MKTRLCWLIFMLTVIIFLVVNNGYARISIQINRPGAVILNIAVPDFYDLQRKGSDYEFGTKIRKIMTDDLDLCGIFNIMDKRVFLVKPEDLWKNQQVNVRNWSTIGADLLLKVGYSLQGDKIEIIFYLMDVVGGETIISKAASGSVNDVRHIIHMIVDEILKALTGEGGILLTKVAFVSTHKGNKEIFISDLDGSNAEMVTNYGTITMLPRIAPDGRGIIFVSYKDNNGPQLFYKDLKAGTVRCLSKGADSASGGAWMPDGKRVIASLTIRGNQDLYMVDLEGNMIKKITDYPGIEVAPAVSPDGTRLAFVSDRGGNPQVYVMDLGGGTPRKVSWEGRYNSSPSWSLKNQLAYTSLVDGGFEIVVTDPEGSRQVRITSGGGNHEDPTWAPNGRYIMYASNREGKYRLYLQAAASTTPKRLLGLEGEQTAPYWFK